MKKLSRRESYKGQNFLSVQLERWKCTLFQEEFPKEEKFYLYQNVLVFLFVDINVETPTTKFIKH